MEGKCETEKVDHITIEGYRRLLLALDSSGVAEKIIISEKYFLSTVRSLGFSEHSGVCLLKKLKLSLIMTEREGGKDQYWMHLNRARVAFVESDLHVAVRQTKEGERLSVLIPQTAAREHPLFHFTLDDLKKDPFKKPVKEEKQHRHDVEEDKIIGLLNMLPWESHVLEALHALVYENPLHSPGNKAITPRMLYEALGKYEKLRCHFTDFSDFLGRYMQAGGIITEKLEGSYNAAKLICPAYFKIVPIELRPLKSVEQSMKDTISGLLDGRIKVVDVPPFSALRDWGVIRIIGGREYMSRLGFLPLDFKVIDPARGIITPKEASRREFPVEDLVASMALSRKQADLNRFSLTDIASLKTEAEALTKALARAKKRLGKDD